MERIHCPLHNFDICIYTKAEEENLFVDDNRREVAVFYNDDGKKYLKRFIMNECDYTCETIQQFLKEE